MWKRFLVGFDHSHAAAQGLVLCEEIKSGPDTMRVGDEVTRDGREGETIVACVAALAVYTAPSKEQKSVALVVPAACRNYEIWEVEVISGTHRF